MLHDVMFKYSFKIVPKIVMVLAKQKTEQANATKKTGHVTSPIFHFVKKCFDLRSDKKA